jgi:hypothetical protein
MKPSIETLTTGELFKAENFLLITVTLNSR